MSWKHFVTLICLVFSDQCQSDSGNFIQEGAKIVYVNPKYIQGLAVFTSRASRKSPYRTTINGTTLHPWGNNVTTTVTVEYYDRNLKIEALKLEFKICDCFKIGWVKEWLIKMNSDLILECPLPAGSYHGYNLEFPPKNFPFPLKNVDYYGKLTWSMPGKNIKLGELEMAFKSKRKTG